MIIASIITAMAGLITAITGLVSASKNHKKNAARIDALEKNNLKV